MFGSFSFSCCILTSLCGFVHYNSVGNEKQGFKWQAGWFLPTQTHFVRILTKFLPYRKIEGCKKSLCRWTKTGCVFRVTGRCKGYKGVGSAADGGERLFPLLTGARQATPTAGALGERTRPYGVWSICAHPITGVNPYSRRYCLHSLRKTATRKIF